MRPDDNEIQVPDKGPRERSCHPLCGKHVGAVSSGKWGDRKLVPMAARGRDRTTTESRERASWWQEADSILNGTLGPI